MTTSFTPILQHCVERVPGAIGAVFADSDGEAVDQFFARLTKEELLVLGAHYGVVLNHVQSLLKLFHYGTAEEVVLHHRKIDVLVRTVGLGYFIVLAVDSGAHLATALREVQTAALALREEMG